MNNPDKRYQLLRNQYWPEVELYFNALSPRLFRQGRLLQVNLAVACSDTGQFKDILCRDIDYPWLLLPFWLLDDFDFPIGEQRSLLEKHTFLAAFFSFTAIFLQESILDEGTFFDRDYLSLLQSLTRQADWHFARLFPNASPFWEYHQAFWRDYSEAILWKNEQYLKKTLPEDAEELLQSAQTLAPGKAIVAAIALKAGREAHLPELLALFDHLDTVYQIVYDIINVRRDLMRGHYTYPIVRTMLKAKIPLVALSQPEQVLGAMWLMNVVDEICQDCRGHLVICREIAETLNLVTFMTHLATVERVIQTIMAIFSPEAKPAATAQPRPPRITFAPHIDHLSKAREMAEGYLLSDLTFRESWEIHRRGTFGVSDLISKGPSGLVIEVLCMHGHDMAKQVDAFYKNLQDVHFHYYEHPYSIPDTDSLGVLLRLYRYSRHKESHADIMKTPLHWMEANILESGQIPVWLTRQIKAESNDRPFVLNLGENCGVVEAHVLLGLIDYDWVYYRGIIEKSALNLLDHFIKQTCGVTINYPPLYMLNVMLRLITELATHIDQGTLMQRIEQASKHLLVQLERETKRRHTSPQDAAFLTLACSHALTRSLFNPRWISILLKNQRCDGSWYGEPFFFVPNRGEALTWYSSHTMTTAFCYHALETYSSLKVKETCKSL